MSYRRGALPLWKSLVSEPTGRIPKTTQQRIAVSLSPVSLTDEQRWWLYPEIARTITGLRLCRGRPDPEGVNRQLEKAIEAAEALEKAARQFPRFSQEAHAHLAVDGGWNEEQTEVLALGMKLLVERTTLLGNAALKAREVHVSRKRSRGRPANVAEFHAVARLADVFQELTGRKPSRTRGKAGRGPYFPGFVDAALGVPSESLDYVIREVVKVRKAGGWQQAVSQGPMETF